MNVAKALNVTIGESNINYCFRAEKKHRKGDPKTIFLGFVSRLKKEEFIKARKVKRTLSLVDIYPEKKGVEAKQPIYINESLTGTNKTLFGKCREYKKRNGVKFLWIKNGNIFMRKSENSNIFLIKSEAALNDVH